MERAMPAAGSLRRFRAAPESEETREPIDESRSHDQRSPDHRYPCDRGSAYRSCDELLKRSPHGWEQRHRLQCRAIDVDVDEMPLGAGDLSAFGEDRDFVAHARVPKAAHS